MSGDYSKYRINVKLEKYDYDRIMAHIGEENDFSNASALARYAITKFLDYLETKQTYNLDEPEK